MIYALWGVLILLVIFGIPIIWLSGQRCNLPTMIRPYGERPPE